MQKAIQTTTMPPHNPIQETEPDNKTTHFQELEKPFSSSDEYNNSKSNNDKSAHYKSHETVSSTEPPLELSKRKEVEERESTYVYDRTTVTVSPKSDGTVEERSSCSGRERLKRHRVEVAGRVWIPDMWGQEDFLKDWIDCAAFDASLVKDSIVSARDSLVEEGRRACASARLGIQNGC